MWITYPDTDNDGLGDRPDGTGLDFNVNTGFQVTIMDKDGTDITATVRSAAQTSGGVDGDSIQFFVETQSNKITIRVRGLVADFVAIFTFTDGVGKITPEGTTFQLNPL